METQEAMTSFSDRTSGPLILLVEDNAINARLVKEILMANGYRITHAKDGLQGVETAREVRPDLILMDLQLPRLDGMSATRIIKADPSTAGIPIVALTAHAMDDHRQQMLASGCCEYVTKPISYQPFLDMIARVLHS
jgi:CheY-like chemotaxis protein